MAVAIHIVLAGSFIIELRSQRSCVCVVAFLLNLFITGMSFSLGLKQCASPFIRSLTTDSEIYCSALKNLVAVLKRL